MHSITVNISIYLLLGLFLTLQKANANPSSDDLSVILVVTQISCGNGDDGLISAATTGGQMPYFYEWSNSATAQTNANLTAGLYSVTVTDLNGCTQTSSTVLVEPAPIILSLLGTDGDCGDISSASVSVVGGNPPYMYEWSNGATNNLIANLDSGLYEVTVSDQNDCFGTGAVEVLSNDTAFSFELDFSPPTCHNAADGSINISILEGLAPYTYYLNGELSDGNFTDLSTGVYSIFISDANGCSDGTSIHLVEPEPISIQFITIDMGLEVLAQNGYPPYEYMWSNGASSSIVDNLSAGTYSVTVSDQNGCTASHTGDVLEPLNNTTISELLDVQLYPNPSVNFSVFQANFAKKVDAKLSILTTSGQIVYSIRSNTKNLQHTLPISDLESGIYLIQLSVGTATSTHKLLVL